MANRKLTKQEIKRRFSKTIDKMIAASGMPTPRKAKRELQQIFFKKTLPSTLETLLPPLFRHQLYQILEKGINQAVKKGCTEQQLEADLAQLTRQAEELPSRLRRALIQMQKSLPRRGGPGRGYSLTIAQQHEACEQVASHMKMKKLRGGFPEAFETVAEDFRAKGIKVSAQTIKRTWQKRDQIYT